MFELIDIFNDTIKCCKTDDSLMKSVEKSINEQMVLLENQEIKLDDKLLTKHSNQSQLVVSHKRTFEAAQNYAVQGKKVCALNFANSFNPGGGVTLGATAQEESLCRVSTLYPALEDKKMMKEFYIPHREKCNHLNNDDIIYTPDVIVFKTDSYLPIIMSKNQWFNVNVITCAAPDLSSYDLNNISEAQLTAIHVQRAKRIIETAIYFGNEVLIMGAFGCGAFFNNPRIVANAYKKVLPNYVHAFECIEFAIYSKTDLDQNYSTFKTILTK